MAVLARETAKILLVHGDSILLCNQAGEPIWHLPGGGMEERESPEQALRREVQEEIGLPLAWTSPVTTLEARWQPFGNLQDTVQETMHLFAGQLRSMTPEGISRKERGLNIRWFPVAHVIPEQGPDFQVRPLEVLKYIVTVNDCPLKQAACDCGGPCSGRMPPKSTASRSKAPRLAAWCLVSDLHGGPVEHAQGRRGIDPSRSREANPALQPRSLAAHLATSRMLRHRLG
jgi:8-oxo-dGTP pyrophosphatase MutT (NUDIX family)